MMMMVKRKRIDNDAFPSSSNTCCCHRHHHCPLLHPPPLFLSPSFILFFLSFSYYSLTSFLFVAFILSTSPFPLLRFLSFFKSSCFCLRRPPLLPISTIIHPSLPPTIFQPSFLSRPSPLPLPPSFTFIFLSLLQITKNVAMHHRPSFCKLTAESEAEEMRPLESPVQKAPWY